MRVRGRILIGLYPALIYGVAAAAAPLLEKTNLFVVGEGGYALYRIPGVILTAKGNLLAYCEARHSNSDWAAMDILLRRSTNGGRSWSERTTLPPPPGPKPKNPVRRNANPAEVTCDNPVAIGDTNGAIHFLFCLEYMRCFYLRSEDEGLTWSQPVEITSTFETFRSEYDWKVIATGPGHGIQLRNGRLIVPVWLSLGTGVNNHSPSVTAAIYSDDHGKTWKRGDIVATDTPSWPSPNETTTLELADGRVVFNMRTATKRNLRLTSTSRDGATGWTTPRFEQELYGPACMGSLTRFSSKSMADRNRIVFSLPAPAEPPGSNTAPARLERKNLTIRISYDEGETWPVRKVLEPGPSAYSDLAVLPDRTLLCFYERSNPGSTSTTLSPYECLTLARFNLDWLTDGKEAAPLMAPKAPSGKNNPGKEPN